MSDINEVCPTHPVVPVKRRESQDQKHPKKPLPDQKHKALPESTGDESTHHVDEYV